VFVYYDQDIGAYFLGRRETALGDGSTGAILTDFDVSYQRASVSGDGSYAGFVDSVNDVCLIPTDGSLTENCAGIPGQVSSIALAADGLRYAFVLLDTFGNPKSSITVVDLRPKGRNRTYQLVSPAIDGVTANTILYADAMTFTGDGRFLI